MRKVCVIGHFGYGLNLFNGQTIKTKNLTRALMDEYGRENVGTIDTHGGITKLPSIFFKVWRASYMYENIIMMPAHNGIKLFGPLLALLSKVTSCKMHYVVIGGWLSSFLQEHKSLINKLKTFSGIYVETAFMKKNLETLGFKKVFVMANFKYLKVMKPNELLYQYEEPFKLCTFSRVMLEKGIEDAIEAVKSVNESIGREAFQLDIYGQVDQNYERRFGNIMNSFPKYIRYCKTVNPNESTKVLKYYFALLFPTYYEGEGFAGTILDAFSAGIPVIASDWKFNNEQVKNGYNGFLVRSKESNDLVRVLRSVFENPVTLNSLKLNCLKSADVYSPENSCKSLFQNLK